MIYGLMSNYRRSWSKAGERTIIDNQQEYVNRYLYSAIDLITGDNFHMFGFKDVNTLNTKIFLEELKEFYKDYYLIIVWDNASFHKSKKLEILKNIKIEFIPPYSPELNPQERRFEDIKKFLKNKVFKTLEELQNKVTDILFSYTKQQIKSLVSYPYLRKVIYL